MPPTVIAIANRKGGTGKTTTAVNLAAEWGSLGHRTLLIDLDTQGHAAIGLGCRELRSATGTIHDVLTGSSDDLLNIVYKTPTENVWLAPANTAFTGQKIDPRCLKHILGEDVVLSQFDRIVLDTPPTLDSLLVNALTAAQGVIVPFVPHHLAEVGVRQLAKLFYQVATEHNRSLKLFGLLPIMKVRHVRLHKRVIETLGKQFGHYRIMRGIRSNIRLAEAFEAGVPVKSLAPRCAGAMDYQLMTDELELLLTNGKYNENDIVSR